MEFPQGCNTDEERLEHVMGVLSQLYSEREEMLNAYKTNQIPLSDFKEWEKNTYLPEFKHASHVKNLYCEVLGMMPTEDDGDGGKKMPDEKRALKDSIKAKALDRNNGKFKDFYKDKKAKDLVEKWNKSMNDLYKDLWKRARG